MTRADYLRAMAEKAAEGSFPLYDRAAHAFKVKVEECARTLSAAHADELAEALGATAAMLEFCSKELLNRGAIGTGMTASGIAKSARQALERAGIGAKP